MNMVRARGRLGAFLALTGILCLCGAAPVAAQRGQLRLEVRDPAGGGVAARGEILSQSNQFQRTFQVASNGNYLLQDVYRGIGRGKVIHPPWLAFATLVTRATASRPLELRVPIFALPNEDALVLEM